MDRRTGSDFFIPSEGHTWQSKNYDALADTYHAGKSCNKFC